MWFEAFPLVYNDIYHFSLGESGLPFIGLLLSAGITGACYLTYNYYVIERDYKRTGTIIPESRLVVALVAAPFGPISLFIFGKHFTREEDFHPDSTVQDGLRARVSIGSYLQLAQHYTFQGMFPHRLPCAEY